jgi:ThiF family
MQEHHLRMTGEQRAALKAHLLPGDGLESVAVAVCGIRHGFGRRIHCIHSIYTIPVDDCSLRTPVRVSWSVLKAIPAINEAIRRGGSLLKIHSHPEGVEEFSLFDDDSDRALFTAIGNISDGAVSGMSAVMTPDGRLFARAVSVEGDFSHAHVTVVSDDILFFGREIVADDDQATQRTKQAFGDRTTAMLNSLRVGIVGCSGTGSWMIEMLARLGVGELVLVDPDSIERKNLNRIVNSMAADAKAGAKKVHVFERAIAAMGLNTKVHSHPTDLAHPEVVEHLASCDILFGCVDSADGRELLNRIGTYYIVPYFDVGVRLDADGAGGISQVCAAIHYLLPGGSSLLNRGVITANQVGAEAMRRTNLEQFTALAKEGYVHGASVGAPAVISLNGFAASHAVNEMLARIHPFRLDDNSEFRYQNLSLRDGAWLRIPDGTPCKVISRRVGRGDCAPLLDNPSLS